MGELSMTTSLKIGLLLGILAVTGIGCARTDCEAMCDSQSACAATGTGADMTEKALESCAKSCEDNIKNKLVMPNGKTFTGTVAKCISDADGSCNEIDACVD